jgi:hypothetical protein
LRGISAVVTWTIEYLGLAVAALRRPGGTSTTRSWSAPGPTRHESVRFYCTHSVDVGCELAKLDADGYRPLRRHRHGGRPR